MADDVFNILYEKRKRVPAECPDAFKTRFRTTLNFRHRFVQSCRFLLVILGFPQAKETNGVLYQAKILPNMHGIARHFNIIKWNQSETDLCASASSQNLQNLSVQWKITCICPFWSHISGSWIKHATRVGALSKTCSKGKLLITSLHSDDMDWYLEFLRINRSTWKKLRKLCFEIHVDKERSR